MQIEMVRTRLQSFRSGLRREEQQVYDRLMRVARSQMQAGVMASNPNPFDSIFLSMLIDLQKQLDQLQDDDSGQSSKK